ncbi:MAG: amidohydrolase family protein, partial [Pseudomonadota bacterium]
MRGRRHFLSFAILFFFSLASSGFSSKPKSTPIALQCGRLLDVVNKKVLETVTVIVEKNKISQVFRGYKDIPNAQAIDLKNKTCSPGFIDLHVHFEQNFPHKMAFQQPDEAQELMESLNFPKKNLMAGFTTVRDLASLRNITASLKLAIARGDIIGPRIITSGVPLSKTTCHIDPISKIKQPKERPQLKK